MSSTFRTGFISLLTLALFAFTGGLRAEPQEQAEPVGGGRTMAMTVEAEVVAIDLDTREVTLKGPRGDTFTITAREQVVKLEDVKVGDRVRATYLAALEGELREPTDSEREQPFVVLEDAGQSAAGEKPEIGAARMIRAVCTIEGMNRLLGTVTVKDSRGKVHVIRDVEPAKMEGVTLGQSIVLVFAEALALSLEKTGE